MTSKRPSFFGNTRVLENELDEFMDAVSEGALVLQSSISVYLNQQYEEFSDKVAQLDELERRADDLKRRVQIELYSEMLVPESRGDILHLIRDLDELLDLMKGKMELLEITREEVPEEYHKGLEQLTVEAVNAVQSTVAAARSYFRDPQSVRDHVQKSGFHESEADKIEKRVLRAIYSSDLPAERKLALREGIQYIGLLADEAEDCADHLLIYAIKRSL